MANIAGPCGAMIMRGSGCAVFDTTTISRPVSGVDRAAGSTVTSKVGAWAMARDATSSVAAMTAKRIDVRQDMAGLECGVNGARRRTIHHVLALPFLPSRPPLCHPEERRSRDEGPGLLCP